MGCCFRGSAHQPTHPPTAPELWLSQGLWGWGEASQSGHPQFRCFCLHPHPGGTQPKGPRLCPKLHWPFVWLRLRRNAEAATMGPVAGNGPQRHTIVCPCPPETGSMPDPTGDTPLPRGFKPRQDALHVARPSGQQGPFFPKVGWGQDRSAGSRQAAEGSQAPHPIAAPHCQAMSGVCLPASPKGPHPARTLGVPALPHPHPELQRHLPCKEGAAGLRRTGG